MASRISDFIPSSLPQVRPTRDASVKSKTDDDLNKSKYAPPHRAQFNYIPSPDALRSMIERALEALSRGVYWDRGSIINLLL